jgi:hypothetical protein
LVPYEVILSVIQSLLHFFVVIGKLAVEASLNSIKPANPKNLLLCAQAPVNKDILGDWKLDDAFL